MSNLKIVTEDNTDDVIQSNKDLDTLMDCSDEDRWDNFTRIVMRDNTGIQNLKEVT